MLILSRRPTEKVIITIPPEALANGPIRISVTFVEKQRGRSSVRLGFDTPDLCDVNREEVQYNIDHGIPRRNAS